LVPLDRFGRIDVLVNNAGMSPVYESLDLVSKDYFDKVIGVNLKGPYRLCTLAGSHMYKHGPEQEPGGSLRTGKVKYSQ